MSPAGSHLGTSPPAHSAPALSSHLLLFYLFFFWQGINRENCECFQAVDVSFTVCKLGVIIHTAFPPYGSNSMELALCYTPFDSFFRPELETIPLELMEIDTIMSTNQKENKPFIWKLS